MKPTDFAVLPGYSYLHEIQAPPEGYESPTVRRAYDQFGVQLSVVLTL